MSKTGNRGAPADAASCQCQTSQHLFISVLLLNASIRVTHQSSYGSYRGLLASLLRHRCDFESRLSFSLSHITPSLRLSANSHNLLVFLFDSNGSTPAIKKLSLGFATPPLPLSRQWRMPAVENRLPQLFDALNNFLDPASHNNDQRIFIAAISRVELPTIHAVVIKTQPNI